jgi:hypothetical protein
MSTATRAVTAFAALAAVLCCARPAAAFTIEYGLDRAPALIACDRQLYAGKRA